MFALAVFAGVEMKKVMSGTADAGRLNVVSFLIGDNLMAAGALNAGIKLEVDSDRDASRTEEETPQGINHKVVDFNGENHRRC